MRCIPIIVLIASFTLFSCSSTSTSQPSPAGTDYPLDTKTGILEVDRVLTAVASGDADRLSSLIHYTTAPCTMKDGLGGPPKCGEGEADGTLIEGLPFISSEGAFRRRDEMTGAAPFRLQEDALHAVYRVSDHALNEEYYPPGDYMIVFTPDKTGYITVLRVDEGGVVRVDAVYADSLKAIIERDAAEVILPPKVR